MFIFVSYYPHPECGKQDVSLGISSEYMLAEIRRPQENCKSKKIGGGVVVKLCLLVMSEGTTIKFHQDDCLKLS